MSSSWYLIFLVWVWSFALSFCACSGRMWVVLTAESFRRTWWVCTQRSYCMADFLVCYKIPMSCDCLNNSLFWALVDSKRSLPLSGMIGNTLYIPTIDADIAVIFLAAKDTAMRRLTHWIRGILQLRSRLYVSSAPILPGFVHYLFRRKQRRSRCHTREAPVDFGGSMVQFTQWKPRADPWTLIVWFASCTCPLS